MYTVHLLYYFSDTKAWNVIGLLEYNINFQLPISPVTATLYHLPALILCTIVAALVVAIVTSINLFCCQ